MGEVAAVREVSPMIRESISTEKALNLILSAIILMDSLDDIMLTLDHVFSGKDRNMTRGYRKYLMKAHGKKIEDMFDIEINGTNVHLENMKKLIADDIKYYIRANSVG